LKDAENRATVAAKWRQTAAGDTLITNFTRNPQRPPNGAKSVKE
jgi:hypothetical protein